MAATKDRRRSSMFGRLFHSQSPTVWEVNQEEDLGLDPVPRKPRVRTLEGQSGTGAERRRTIGAPEQLTVDAAGSHFSMRSNGSMYSVSTIRSHGSTVSNTSERPLRTPEDGIPPISPMTNSSRSLTSNERASARRSHIQLVPRSMLPPESLPASIDEIRRMDREMQIIAARDRRSRGFSSNSGDAERPPSRSGDDYDRPRSDASSNGTKIRIQYVPKSSLPPSELDAVPNIPITPVAANPVSPGIRSRISRSLTAVTEETRINSEYHSDIEEGEEEPEEDTEEQKET